MLFGAANIDLGALGIPDVTGYREHLYQVTAGKIVFPSVNGPIPEQWPTTPAGVTGFYTIYPHPDHMSEISQSADDSPDISDPKRLDTGTAHIARVYDDWLAVARTLFTGY